MRFNFSFVEPERIRRGIELLSEVIRERMELGATWNAARTGVPCAAAARPSARTVRVSWRAWLSCAADTRWSGTSPSSRGDASSTPSNASATRSIPSI